MERAPRRLERMQQTVDDATELVRSLRRFTLALAGLFGSLTILVDASSRLLAHL